MRILILTRYTQRGASSRYRLWQYVPLFERAGHEVVVRPLVSDSYLEGLYTNGHRPCCALVKGYARRFADLLRLQGFDAAICEQEAFPFLPAKFEQLVRRCALRLFLDYDDAPYVRYESWPILRQKMPKLLASADGVIVGNCYLSKYAQSFTTRVFIVPTTVDLASYPDRQTGPLLESVRVVWIGTPVTVHLLRPVLPVMVAIQQEYPDVVFRLIGAGRASISSGLRIELCDWSEETEAPLLAECDIGIMPLPDTEFARGKCGLKLIQYMAAGLPVVASPVGANCEIVNEGRNGFLPADEREWFAALDNLIRNPQLRHWMGQAGRAKVAENYTLERGFARWLGVIEGRNWPRDAASTSW